MDLNQVTKAYLAIREARAELRRKFDNEDSELKGKLHKLENVMLEYLNANNLEATRTETGTFYRQEAIKPSCSDWSAFWEWMKQEDALDAMEKRVKATFMKEYMEMHDSTLPPGISVHREYEVRVRRAS
jgi:hypothetical protein